MSTISKAYPQFLLFGDSIIEQAGFLRDSYSFGAVLQERCNRRSDVVNRGLSGYNTANALVVLPDIVPTPEQAKVSYMLVLFGANDSCLPGGPTKQHVKLETYRQNIREILTHQLVKAQDPTIFLITPPPINEAHLWEGDKAKGFSEVTRHQSITAQYADAVRAVAAELKNDKIMLIDLHAAILEEAIKVAPQTAESNTQIGTLQAGDHAGLRALLLDGLHLTGAGYKIFIDAILPHVPSPSFVFPYWPDAPRNDAA